MFHLKKFVIIVCFALSLTIEALPQFGDIQSGGHDVDCVLSEWKNITKCTKSCGGGTQLEQKHILVPHDNNGKKCPNIPPTKTTNCNTHPCPGIHISTIY